jgi:hypothetical protein
MTQEEKDNVRRKALERNKSRASSVKTTISHGTSIRPTSPLANCSLVSIESSTGPPRTSSTIELDSLSPRSTITSGSTFSTSTLPTSVPSEVVESPLSSAPSEVTIVRNNITSSESSRRTPLKRHTTPAAMRTQALSPTTQVAPTATIDTSQVTETSTVTHMSIAADTLRNSTSAQAGTRGWWQTWVDPIIGLVARPWE